MIKLKDGFDGERAIVLPQLIISMIEEDPLLAALHITDIGYYPKAEHHFRERNQPINQYVFIYCIDGAGWESTNIKSAPINTLSFRQAYRMLMQQTRLRHGQSTGYTSKVHSLHTMPAMPCNLWTSNPKHIRVSATESISSKRYSIH